MDISNLQIFYACKIRTNVKTFHYFIFMDIVGSSNPILSTEKQVEKINTLNDMIRECKSFKNNPEKIIIPTGDGNAIGFEEPHLPLELAIELHRKLREYNREKQWIHKILLHIGIHSQHVLHFTDLNENNNVWGDGTIIAQRIMSKAPEGFILLSEDIGKELMKSEKYKKIIYHAGNIKLKYQRQFVWYAYDDDFGRNDISEITDLDVPYSTFFAEIVGKKQYKIGDIVKVDFTGELTAGFFDVMLRAPEGYSFPKNRPNRWIPAPDTFDQFRDRGNLKGKFAKVSEWEFPIEQGYPIGEYKVYIRVYDQLSGGQRPVIREKVETIYVTED